MSITEVFRHRRGIHNLARIHDPLRVKCGLDFAKGRVKAVAKQLPVPMAARQTVSVLAAHRTLEFNHQVFDRSGKVRHSLDLGAVFEIDQRTDMQAPDRRMAVEASPSFMPVQYLLEPADILAKILRTDGRVLDESYRLGVPPHAGQQAKPCFTDCPDVRLVFRADCVYGRSAHASGVKLCIQLRQLVFKLPRALSVELHDQDRRGIALDKIHSGSEGGLESRQIQQHLVHQFHRGRPELQYLLRGLHSRNQVREVDNGKSSKFG